MSIKELIKKHEGYSNQVYKDSLGFLTVGVGHKVLPGEDFIEGETYNDEVLMNIFDKDFQRAVNGAKILTDGLDIDPVAFDVITCMVFQLGQTGTSKFKNMFLALEIPDYGLASEHMLQSKWHSQTKNRCEELAEMMRSCGR